MRFLRQEARVNGKDMLWLLLIELIAFVFGVLLLFLIMALDQQTQTYFSMGFVIAAFAAILMSIVYNGMVYQTRFQMAIAMGRSRRGQILAHVIFTPLQCLLLLAVALALGRAELLLYKVIYPTIEN